MAPQTALMLKMLGVLCLSVFFLGGAWRLLVWLRTPEPLLCPLPPFGKSRSHRLRRQMAGAFWLGRLGRWSPVSALLSGLMHLCLLALFLAHLRLIITPAPAWLAGLGGLAHWAGPGLALVLVLLILMRMNQAQLALASRRGDYFILILLLVLTLSGIYLSGPGRTDLVAAKVFCLGLLGLDAPKAAPPNLAFGLHFFLAAILAAVFPFSKLIHCLGFVFMPSRRQEEPGSGQGHVNPWEREYAGDNPSQAAVLSGEPGLYTLEAYCQGLKERWAQAGTARVLGAGERRESLAKPKGGSE